VVGNKGVIILEKPVRRFWTVAEVATYLNLHRTTVFKWAKEGRFPFECKKVGTTLRFEIDEVIAYADNLERVNEGIDETNVDEQKA
jgi:excisionase family DNA binding protein